MLQFDNHVDYIHKKFRYGKRPSSPSNNFTLNPIKKQKTVEIELDTEDDVKQTQMKKPSDVYATKLQLKKKILSQFRYTN